MQREPLFRARVRFRLGPVLIQGNASRTEVSPASCRSPCGCRKDRSGRPIRFSVRPQPCQFHYTPAAVIRQPTPPARCLTSERYRNVSTLGRLQSAPIRAFLTIVSHVPDGPFFENHQNRWYPSNTRVILGGVEWAGKFGNLSRRRALPAVRRPTDGLTARRCDSQHL